jgi:hypothetical protein
MLVKGVFLSLLLVCSLVSAMDPILYESPKKPWEANYKTAVVAGYDAATLVTHFEDLRLSAAMPAHIDGALRVIVTHATGKDIVSDIISRLEPQVQYVNSLLAIVGAIDANRGDPLTAQNAVRACFGLMNSLDPNSVTSVVNVNTFLPQIGSALLLNLENTPAVIPVAYYAGNVFATDYSGAANSIYPHLKAAVDIVNDRLKEDRFEFGDAEDSYNPINRRISVRNAVFKVSKITGPNLFTFGAFVGIAAEDLDFSIDERLSHEILHYDHITLRKESFSDILLIGRLLIGNGFYPSYTGILQGLWTNSEEFRTMTGLFERGGRLLYFRLSEYRYLADKLGFLRCSHSASYCTKVAACFINLIRDKLRITVNLRNNTDREYVKQYDEI